ncbi:unnamed protein product, partial [Rotaria sp. Silwood1]
RLCVADDVEVKRNIGISLH